MQSAKLLFLALFTGLLLTSQNAGAASSWDYKDRMTSSCPCSQRCITGDYAAHSRSGRCKRTRPSLPDNSIDPFAVAPFDPDLFWARVKI